MRSSTVPPFGLKVVWSFSALYESRARCHRQACPWRLVRSTTHNAPSCRRARRTATEKARLLNRVRRFGFLAALICQGLLFEQRLGVEGFDLDPLLFDHGHVFAARLPFRLVLGAGDIERDLNDYLGVQGN